METQRYVSENSNKLVEVSANWSKKYDQAFTSPALNMLVICHEIIDVDVGENCGDDGNVKFNDKGKGILIGNGSSGNSGPVDAVQSSKKDCLSSSNNPIIVDDFGSDVLYGADEHMNMLDDRYMTDLYDDYAVLQSHFNNMDIPTGIEATIPWMFGPLEEQMVSTTTSTLGRDVSGAARDQSTSFSSSTLVGQPTLFGLSSSSPEGKEGQLLIGSSNAKSSEGVSSSKILSSGAEKQLSSHCRKKFHSSGATTSFDWNEPARLFRELLMHQGTHASGALNYFPQSLHNSATTAGSPSIPSGVYESRMNLLRVVIMGDDGTPYHNGLFFFDVFFPSNYLNVPPLVHYHSFGLRINPNLYNCGKEKGIPRVSTVLQVLVSIQGLILNAKPYFNEPGDEISLRYIENTYMLKLKTMVFSMRQPPKHFEDFVLGHFFQSAQDVLVACKAYMDGAQVGSLVRGGVQDVDEGNKSCSSTFRASLIGIKTVIDTFKEIGAKYCDKFLHLAQRGGLGVVAPVVPANAAGYFYS
ncbi:unnamed protein product [Withania somnifera]